jgi:hypothetical protein
VIVPGCGMLCVFCAALGADCAEQQALTRRSDKSGSPEIWAVTASGMIRHRLETSNPAR